MPIGIHTGIWFRKTHRVVHRFCGMAALTIPDSVDHVDALHKLVSDGIKPAVLCNGFRVWTLSY